MSATSTFFGAGESNRDAAIAQRRALEAERLKRVKDPKLRTMGIDLAALDAQVAEKKAMAAAEKALDDAYDQQRMAYDQHLAQLERERIQKEKERQAALEEYRASMQGKEKSRDYDLNDPKWRTQVDLDSQLASGMQKFYGEDMIHAARVKRQQQELKDWCDEVRGK